MDPHNIQADAHSADAATGTVRRRFGVRGQVQGVGFRPFVYRLATGLHLAGHVGNDMHGAFIEVEGPPADLDRFTARLHSELPPLAKIDELTREDLPATGERRFHIEGSRAAGRQDARITPDTATCDDCRREMLDPSDRRHRYPFINCTNCGPRYSIIRSAPYDRPNTTMVAFTMCPDCQREYDDPMNRRFHAQPNACPVCGPRIRMVNAAGEPIEGDPLDTCVALLTERKIVAVKGLGGFHLACRADDDEAVMRLRDRKARESKPLAIMVGDLQAAGVIGRIEHEIAAVLTDPARPIVLVPKRQGAAISPHVAPGTDLFGVMLPYTPLHALLLAESGLPLVMTSGNPTDEPLCSDNGEALRRLAHIADAFCLHDRDIERRIDDSVVLAAGPRTVPLRRARGYVPSTIATPASAAEPILAVGGELKSAVCILNGSDAVLSEHLGELPNAAAYRNFIATVEQFKRLLRVEPRVIAYDPHPNYAATRHALSLPGEHVAIQHHHAHLVSCMADNGLTGRVIGILCDGTGYGTDGTIWGCEILVGDETDFDRAAHLRPFVLPGVNVAAKQTWRPAIALLYQAFGADWPSALGSAAERIEAEALGVVRSQLTRPDRLPRASSLGRLFDAAAFLIGICDLNRHEAEAPMALEAAARRSDGAEPLPYEIDDADGAFIVDVRPMIRRIVADVAAGRDGDDVARAFHETVAAALTDAAVRVAEAVGFRRVVLSGGCFANRLLLTALASRLEAAGLEAFSHRQAPPGDGGLALGQAVAAAAMTARNR